MQVLDIFVSIIIFMLACFFGKISMAYFGDIWIAFNVSAFGTLVIGEIVWWRVRKKIAKKWENKFIENYSQDRNGKGDLI